MARPTVLLDVDGVLADFIGRVCRVASSIVGRDLKPEDVRRFNFAAELGLSPDQKREVHRFIESTGFWRDLEPYAGAVEGVESLREIADIFIASAPWHSSRTWLHERASWLEHFFDIGPDRLIACSAKHLLMGHVLVDDKTETVRAWWNAAIARTDYRTVAIQWITPHNRLDEWTGRATRSWDDVYAWTKEIANHV